MGVIPASPFVEIKVERRGWATYGLVGFQQCDIGFGGWPIYGAYFTRRGAERSARRLLKRQHPSHVSTIKARSWSG